MPPSPHNPPRPRRNCPAGSLSSSHIAAEMESRKGVLREPASCLRLWPCPLRGSLVRPLQLLGTQCFCLYDGHCSACPAVTASATGVIPPLAGRLPCHLPSDSCLLSCSLTVCSQSGHSLLDEQLNKRCLCWEVHGGFPEEATGAPKTQGKGWRRQRTS